MSSKKTPFHLAILTKVSLASEVCPVAKSHLGDSGTNKMYARKIRFNEAIAICNKKEDLNPRCSLLMMQKNIVKSSLS